jgi:hypothetical protein
MELEKQVCSLEYSQTLKGLGVRQVSLYYRMGGGNVKKIIPKELKEEIQCSVKDPNEVEYWSAFTAAELVQMNDGVKGAKQASYPDGTNRWFVQTSVSENVNDASQYTNCKTFSDACAVSLIMAIEHKWVTVEEVNERLLK